MTDPSEITKNEYEALAAFRAELRRYLRFTEEGARSVGLTPQQHQLLLAVKGQPGKDWATVSALAEALQIKHHAAVMLADRCEQGGWIRRTPDDADRRQVKISLTSEGEKILSRLSAQNLRELTTLRQLLRSGFQDTPAK